MEPKRKKELTILLLGETGVGKSTWINGFANVVKFNSLTQAERCQTVCVVPASFNITDDNYQEQLVRTGRDANEVTDPGQSATQTPKTYILQKDDMEIRLIDTPGIGDVRGVEQDKKNFEFILDHISNLDNLDLICILLKPDNSRLNIMFQFCIKELLTHLHKDAIRNIVFCFTNCRSTFYRPGETLPTLKRLFQENHDIDIKLNHSNLFCVDNESVRYLYAVKANVPFSEECRKNYEASWQRAVSEINRLIERGICLEPHPIRNTISLNNARQTILALRNPIAEVTKMIQINIAEKELVKENCLKQSKNNSKKDISVTEYSVRYKDLAQPRTVCTSPKCIQYVDIAGHKDIVYNTHCHAYCTRDKRKHFEILNSVGHRRLKNCSAFDRTGKCKRCGCSWTQHMKITQEAITEAQTTTEVLGPSGNHSAPNSIESVIQKMELKIKELEDEQTEISSARVQFAQFLRFNSITPFNDSLNSYMQLFIDQEQIKVDQGHDDKVLKRMKKQQNEYQSQMNALEEIMTEETASIFLSAVELDNRVKNLFQLKKSGPMLKDMMENSRKSAKKTYVEVIVERNPCFSNSFANDAYPNSEQNTDSTTRKSSNNESQSHSNNPIDRIQNIFHPNANRVSQYASMKPIIPLYDNTSIPGNRRRPVSSPPPPPKPIPSPLPQQKHFFSASTIPQQPLSLLEQIRQPNSLQTTNRDERPPKPTAQIRPMVPDDDLFDKLKKHVTFRGEVTQYSDEERSDEDWD